MIAFLTPPTSIDYLQKIACHISETRRMGIPQKIGGELRLSFFNGHTGSLEVTLEIFGEVDEFDKLCYYGRQQSYY